MRRSPVSSSPGASSAAAIDFSFVHGAEAKGNLHLGAVFEPDSSNLSRHGRCLIDSFVMIGLAGRWDHAIPDENALQLHTAASACSLHCHRSLIPSANRALSRSFAFIIVVWVYML
jgi:hypothetical protein